MIVTLGIGAYVERSYTVSFYPYELAGAKLLTVLTLMPVLVCCLSVENVYPSCGLLLLSFSSP
jgi:hypothetical protein